MGQTMGYQNNGGRPWGTRIMGADHGVPEQWGQTMGYQNNGADHGVPEQ